MHLAAKEFDHSHVRTVDDPEIFESFFAEFLSQKRVEVTKAF